MRPWLARHGRECAVGLALTVAAVAIHAAGLTNSLEWAGFDFNVRNFSRVPASDRIVHIDIDDAALERVGSWPWPRDLQGELIRTLKDLGAEQIITDIVWSEPKPPEVRIPGLERFADLEGLPNHIGEASADNLVFPDDELAAAIAEAGNVSLAMYYEPARETGGPQAAATIEQQIADLLRHEFELNASALAERTRIPQAEIENVLAGIKRRIAEERVAEILDRDPSAGFEQIHRAILTTPLNRYTADREDLLAAFERVMSLRALRDRCPVVPEALKGRLPRVSRVIPPIYKLTAGARRTGFVTFLPDRDGRTRHVPLLLDWEGRLLEHLAFGAARDALGITVADLAIDDRGFLVIRGTSTRPEQRIQLDERGQLLINWHVAQGDWPGCFTHRPVALFLQLCECRRRIDENDRLRRWKLAQVVRLTRDDAGFDLYRTQLERLLDLERRARWASLRNRATNPADQADTAEILKLRRSIQRDQDDAVALVREEWATLQKEARPTDTQAADDYRRFREAHSLVDGDLADLQRTNAGIQARYELLRHQLRPMIERKICFVGYTATAVADMVTTPAYRHVPGVLVHSSVLNSFLAGDFLTWTRQLGQAGVILLFGLLVTVVASSQGPWRTLLLLLVVTTVAFLLNGLAVFARLDHWLRLLTAVALTFVVWALIVMFRYLTTDRDKRRFSRAVAQYVSPAMARQLADQADNLDLTPVNGYVSCFFSDLVGFTPISERLGPEGTRTLLNPYLQVMSAALQQRQALINKFMGDGIFAFFNPPILPCAGHEVAACEAALACREALEGLKCGHLHHPLAAEFQRLAMRIGIASGPVFVGDYGSENKLDYTCVGDTVNLAARLEAANKAMGSSIMIDDATRRAAGERFIYRPLGLLLVQGRTSAVEVHELLGRPGQIDDETFAFATLFAQAVDHFTGRRWQQATATFNACLEHRKDPATALYLKVLENTIDNPPPSDWTPCLEVLGK